MQPPPLLLGALLATALLPAGCGPMIRGEPERPILAIAVDGAGHVAMPFNSTGMFRGYRRSDGKTEVRIWGE